MKLDGHSFHLLTRLNNILLSWPCVVKFLLDKVYIGHYQILTQEYNIDLITALFADVLLIFSRYQQQLQSDECNFNGQEKQKISLIKLILKIHSAQKICTCIFIIRAIPYIIRIQILLLLSGRIIKNIESLQEVIRLKVFQWCVSWNFLKSV